MLKKIPASLTPDLVKMLMEMGCGDELLLCGRDYPAKGIGVEKVCYINGSVEELLKDVLKLMPLSDEVASATMYFEEDEESPICCRYESIIKDSEEVSKIEKVDRLDKYPFLNRAERVYCAVVTSSGDKGCEIILTKGRI